MNTVLENTPPVAGRWPGYVALGLAVLGALGFQVVMIWMVVFLWNIPVLPVTVSGAQSVQPVPAIAVNIGLILLFGLQHSLMARGWATRAIGAFAGKAAVRGIFNIASAATLAVLFLFWQPFGPVIYDLGGGWAAYCAFAFGVAGLVIANWALMVMGPLAFYGIAGALNRISGQPDTPPKLIEPGPYRYVRHPMQTGALLFVWATPLMTASHLVFAAGMTIYIFIGLYFEERALLRVFGSDYEGYRRRVPRLFPRLRGG